MNNDIARFNMIEQQIRPWEVLDGQVLSLLSAVKRENFVPMANKALAFVDMEIPLQAHGTQKRASGDPYFSHPIEVAGILTELRMDDETICTALLHDTIEDTEATREEIDRLFGSEIQAAPWLKSLAHQQALLQIYRDFCLEDLSDCDQCPFPEQLAQWQP